MSRDQPLTQLVELLNRAHDRRITQTTLDYWRSRPVDDRLIVVAALGKNGDMLAVSACQIVDDTKTTRTITVTHPSYRKKGLGKMVLMAKVRLLTEAGIVYRTTIAADNNPSRKMAESAGLILARSEVATRCGDRQQTFELCTYTAPHLTVAAFNQAETPESSATDVWEFRMRGAH